MYKTSKRIVRYVVVNKHWDYSYLRNAPGGKLSRKFIENPSKGRNSVNCRIRKHLNVIELTDSLLDCVMKGTKLAIIFYASAPIYV
jgi:hypothetical protein